MEESTMVNDSVSNDTEPKEIGTFVRNLALVGVVLFGILSAVCFQDAIFGFSDIHNLLYKIGRLISSAYLAWVFWYAYKTGKNPFNVFKNMK